MTGCVSIRLSTAMQGQQDDFRRHSEAYRQDACANTAGHEKLAAAFFNKTIGVPLAKL